MKLFIKVASYFLLLLAMLIVQGGCGLTESPFEGALSEREEGEPDGSEGQSAFANTNTGPTAKLAGSLLIDGSVHTGSDWNGAPYVGVWGETFQFNMQDYPLTWAIALVHASKLLQSRSLNYSPNAVLSVAIKESRLGCASPSFPNRDGCFQIESTTAYTELQRLFPERFNNSHTKIISDEYFETSALSMVYYTLFSMGMFYLHSDDPYGFFERHADPYATQKMISAAYNRGLWWTGLKKTFDGCQHQDVTNCFENHNIAIDHATAITNYTNGLNSAEPFEAQITLSNLQNYWESIRPFYPEISDEDILAVLEKSFNKTKKAGLISFQNDIDTILDDLIEALPTLPIKDDVVAATCEIGYQWSSPPCP